MPTAALARTERRVLRFVIRDEVGVLLTNEADALGSCDSKGAVRSTIALSGGGPRRCRSRQVDMAWCEQTLGVRRFRGMSNPSYWLKMVGTARDPLANNWIETKPELLRKVRSPWRPSGIKRNDILVY
jgi:hypothetical protein